MSSPETKAIAQEEEDFDMKRPPYLHVRLQTTTFPPLAADNAGDIGTDS